MSWSTCAVYGMPWLLVHSHVQVMNVSNLSLGTLIQVCLQVEISLKCSLCTWPVIGSLLVDHFIQRCSVLEAMDTKEVSLDVHMQDPVRIAPNTCKTLMQAVLTTQYGTEFFREVCRHNVLLLQGRDEIRKCEQCDSTNRMLAGEQRYVMIIGPR